MTVKLMGDIHKDLSFKYPDYAVITCDNRPHLDYTAELNFMGQLIDSDESWEFYRAEKFERPSKQELKYLKGIIISGSIHVIKNL
jgi:hypothetical protein